MAEWLGTGLQNQVQQFDSAWYLIKKTDKSVGFFYEVPFHPTAARHPMLFAGGGKPKNADAAERKPVGRLVTRDLQNGRGPLDASYALA